MPPHWPWSRWQLPPGRHAGYGKWPNKQGRTGVPTVGSLVGDDGGANQVGVAPGAKWIGCRNMNQGVGTPATYIECFEFFLAPYPVAGTPSQGNPELAPDVTSNSWGCPPSEGCSALSLQAAVEAQRAAGEATVPTTIGVERTTNLFLRAGRAEELGALRAAKDSFRS